LSADEGSLIMPGDWIRLHRKLLDSAVFGDEWLLKLWVWCLLRAGYCDRISGGFKVPAGSFITGRFAASDELNVSPSRWYRGIHQLASLGMVTLSASQERTIVTICNWETYQSQTDVREQQVNSARAQSEQQTNNARAPNEQQVNSARALIQEGKEGKDTEEGKEVGGIPPTTPLENGNGKPKRKLRKPRAITPYSPDFELFWASYPKTGRTDKPGAFEEWPVAVQRAMLDPTTKRDGEAAVAWIVNRAGAYATSQQGTGQFCRKAMNWLSQAGFDEPQEVWNRTENQSGANHGKQQRQLLPTDSGICHPDRAQW